MILQDRDQRLIQSIEKYKVLSTHQIAKLFFAGVAHTTLMRRLRILEKKNFLRRGVTLSDGTNTWTLGHQGRRIVNSKPSNIFMNRNTIEHDVLLTDLRMLFEGMGLAQSWTPECEMKSAAMKNDRDLKKERVIPDGLMIEPIRGEANVIAVELERTRKSAKRYNRTLYQYSYKTSIEIIWYIAKDLGVINAIINAANELRFPMARLWFSLEHQTFGEKQKTPVWLAGQSKWVPLHELNFDNLKPAHAPTHGVSSLASEKVSGKTEGKSLNSEKENEFKQSPGNRPVAANPTPPTKEEGEVGSAATGR